MFPDLIQIGNYTIQTAGALIALAILVATFLIYRQAPGCKLNRDQALEALVITIVAGFIGARLSYVAINWSFFLNQSLPFQLFSFEGLSIFGGLGGGSLALFVWSKWRNVGFFRIADFFAPYFALSYAIGRLGCFFNGCCFGRISAVPWAMPAQAADPFLRHPVQLYAALGALIIFIILKCARPYRYFVGYLFLLLLILYGLLRFVVEFFRQGDQIWLGLTVAQVASFILIFLALSFIALFLFYLSPTPNGKADLKLKEGKQGK